MTSSRAANGVLRVLLLVALGVAIATWSDAPYVREVLPLAALAIAVQLFPIVWEREIDPFSPPIATGAMTGLGLVAIASSLVATERVFFRDMPELGAVRAAEVTRTVFLLVTVATLAYQAGYYLSAGRRVASWMPRVEGLRWDAGRLMVVTIVCGAAFVSTYSYFQSALGLSLLSLNLFAGKEVWRDDPTLSWMFRGIGLGQLPLLLYGAHILATGRRRGLWPIAAIGAVEAFLIMRTGARGLAVLFLVNLLVVYHYLGRRQSFLKLAPIVIGSIMAFNVLGQLRLSEGGRADALSPGRRDVGAVLEQHEEDRQRLTAMAAIVHHFPERRDFLLGESWAGMIASPIPRWIWPSKSQYFKMRDTNILTELIGVSTPTPLPFLLYENFSWIGVVAGMALWGAFHRGLARWREEHPRDAGVVLLYSLMLFYFGPTLGHMSNIMQFIIPAWVAIILVGRRVAAQRGRGSALAPAAPAPGTSP